MQQDGEVPQHTIAQLADPLREESLGVGGQVGGDSRLLFSLVAQGSRHLGTELEAELTNAEEDPLLMAHPLQPWEIPSFCSRFQREIEHEGEKTGRFSRNFASRLPAFM